MDESNESPSKSSGARNLRDRKDRKLYADDWMLIDEDDADIGRRFKLEEKIEADRFPALFVKEMRGEELTVSYMQKYGFHSPILIREKDGLGLRVPGDDFDVNQVKMWVGSRRVVDVMDVGTQKNHQMTMKEWAKYYNDQDKDRLLNVISLEFSHTKLDEYVQSPTIVRQLDWVDTAWPPTLKKAQVEATNAIDDMMYPKVQKYCLMSVKGCYTDFHIDFGGTSVWYHILKGSKIFWLIPPNSKNIALYENWVLSGKQSDVFFGDTVKLCSRIRLAAGNTFFIPSGWIHAVFTPDDSLVFGGNFLHSFSMSRQISIAKVENLTHVPQKFKYPFFTEMLWYVLAKYVMVLMGVNHLDDPDSPEQPLSPPADHIHITHEEITGIKDIVWYLHGLHVYRKNVPDMIKDPIAIIRNVRTIVADHRNDVQDLAATGRYVLTGVQDDEIRAHDEMSLRQDSKLKFQTSNGSLNQSYSPTPTNQNNQSLKLSTPKGFHKSHQGGPRRRRTRCKKCGACQRNDCGDCAFCMDMVKFGGPGRAKQTCVMRQCLQPMLPVTAACLKCGLDGWGQQPVIPIQKTPRETPSSLMECSVCYDIAHPDCYTRMYPKIEGVINEDLPNSWECPKCIKEGHVQYRPRHFRARQKSNEVRRMSYNSDPLMDNVEVDSESRDSDSDSHDGSKMIKLELKDENSPSEGPTGFFTDAKSSENEPRKINLRAQIAQQITGQSNKMLKRPQYVVRPGTIRTHVPVQDGNPVLERSVMVSIFRYLSPQELVECSLVCRAWARFSLDPSLWQRMDLSHRRLTASHLAGIARRQPEILILDWSSIAKKQLGWLISRLPQLRGLSVQGCSWLGVSALGTCVCPPLHLLDLSFVGGLNDSSLRDVLSPPSDSRPGLTDTRTRLRHLRCLKLAGCDITDVSLRYITQHLPRLSVLDMSSCSRITDAGVAQLATTTATTLDTLTSLNLASLRSLTDVSLEHLSRCLSLTRLNISHTPLITQEGVETFTKKLTDIEIIGKE